ncbi:MAG: carbohydrate kinase [Bacteroidales bacterium]|nr:carbohydrate kinase [Bacteroidales bacterium]
MYTIGYDIGSSSVKAALLDTSDGSCIASAYSPEKEMTISAPQSGWAEQDPEMWWLHLKNATKKMFSGTHIDKKDIKAIGISYQMHGLVAVDKELDVLRPSIIWCDSRAVETGNRIFKDLGAEKCLFSLLNSPGNFTASKLEWVKDNEPELFKKIHKIMLPGDYIAMRMTGNEQTTIPGLSEGIFWDFRNNSISDLLLNHIGILKTMLPEIIPTFSDQGALLKSVSDELDLPHGLKVSYRAGDQPNNAFSLNVLEPGEVAATAGTSGVIYGVTDQVKYDPESRVNSFAHVNYTEKDPRIGVLLCINGTGILNSWLKKNVADKGTGYKEMNMIASGVSPGSNGLLIYPFGNGAERVLNNRDIGSIIKNLNFNIHHKAHLFRAAQEGIVFSLKYGMDVMKDTGIETGVIRAGNANMFLSDLFSKTLATLTGAVIELYNTDGALGAARGAAIGAGLFRSPKEAFGGLTLIKKIEPDIKIKSQIHDSFEVWKKYLMKNINSL